MILFLEYDNSLHSYLLKEGKNTVSYKGKEAVFYQYQGVVTSRTFPLYETNKRIELKHQSRLKVLDEHRRVVNFSVSSNDIGYLDFHKYEISKQFITISTIPDCDITIKDCLQKQFFLQLDMKERYLNIKEGICYLNHCYCRKNSYFEIGDLLEIENIKIILSDTFLMVNQVPNLKISLSSYKIPLGEILEEKESSIEFGPIFRDFKKIKPLEMELKEPEPYYHREWNPIIFSMGPAITMASAALLSGMLSFRNGILNGRNWQELLPSILLPFVMIFSAVTWNPAQRRYEKHKEKQANKKRIENYRTYLGEVEKEIEQKVSQIKQMYYDAFLSPDKIEQNLNNNSQLWSKSHQQEDWLCFRVGIGDVPYSTNLLLRSHFQINDPIPNLFHEIEDRFSVIEEIPIVLSLGDYESIYILSELEQKYSYLQMILNQFCYYYSPSLLKICFIIDEEFLLNNPWIFQISHIYCVEFEKSRLIVSSKKELDILLDKFKEIPQYQYVFINLTDHIFHPYTDNGKFHWIQFINSKMNITTNSCLIDFGQNQIWTSNEQYHFIPDVPLQKNPYSLYSNLLQIHWEKDTHKPVSSNSFFDLYGHSITLEDIQSNWLIYNRNHLIAPIGFENSYDIFSLDLSESGHGPHGLIAGMTGSGKSELIITMVLSLAVQYPPEEIQFVFIDFKGGGSSSIFKNPNYPLPHLIGSITNLEQEDMERALMSFRLECEQRERYFQELSNYADHPIVNLSQYKQYFNSDYHLPYLADLVIIVDEFAELKRDYPDFMKDLVQIARIGRSLGIHLILVTQKPAGIVDEQIWSNSRFKIALKVQERQDSMEILHKDYASKIQRPGEFYFLCDNQIKNVTSAYTHESAEREKDCLQISLLQQERVSHNDERSTKSQLNEVLQQIHLASKDKQPQKQLWLPKPVNKKIIECPNRDNKQFGIIDDYVHRKQYPITNEMFSNSTFVFCTERKVKDEWIKSYLCSCLEDEYQYNEIYIVNTLGIDLSYVESFPQMIAIIQEEENQWQSIYQRLTNNNNHSHSLVIITDYDQFLQEKENHKEEIQTIISIQQKNHIDLMCLGTTSSSIPYKDLLHASQIVVLQNDNIQEITTILEKRITTQILNPYGFLYRKDRILSGIFFQVTSNDFEQLLLNYSSLQKRTIIPHIPKILTLEDYTGDEVPLGMDYQSYDWVTWTPNTRLFVLATYMEELLKLENLLKQHENVLIMDNYESLNEDWKGICILCLEEYMTLDDSLKQDSNVLYIGEGYHEQYLFKNKENWNVQANEGIYFAYKNRKVRYLRVLEK